MRTSTLSRTAVVVCLGAVLASCGATPTPAPIAVTPATVTPGAVTPAVVTATSPGVVAPVPATGRLQRTYDAGYDPKGYSLGNYRMDPAPRSLRSRMTPEQVLAAVYRSTDASFARGTGARVITRFGLFSGFDATEKNGTFGPTRAIVRRPAWLVVVSGVPMLGSGGGVPPPGVTRPPQTPTPGWILIVVYDDTGQPQSVVTEQGADPHVA